MSRSVAKNTAKYACKSNSRETQSRFQFAEMPLNPFLVFRGGAMAQRKIKTVDGQRFEDHCDRFQDRNDCILYRRGLFNTVRINKRNISTDNIYGAGGDMMLALMVLGFLIAGLIILSNSAR
jgi:hypothetical protein